MELPLVQILVKVANTQVRSLWTEVGKGFMTIEVSHELVDPKVMVNSTQLKKYLRAWKMSDNFQVFYMFAGLKRYF